MVVRTLCALALTIAVVAAPGSAQVGVEDRLRVLQGQVEELRRELAGRDTVGVAELRRQIEVITRELEALRLGDEVMVAADTGSHGFAPAAAKVYRVRQGVSIGGYGEVHYENFAEERQDESPSGRADQFDTLRAIVYFGYKFNDRILFNSEMEWEHGSTSQGGGEASIEFAYLDYRLARALGLRAGLLLAPMGLTNELHEPPIYLGSTRPLAEQSIIPTTWRANGVGLFGDVGRFSYRAYLLTSLDAVGAGSSTAGGFSAGGLRGGRQKGAREVAEDFSLVGRVDFVGVPGLTVGGSAMTGETAHDRRVNDREIGGRTLIWEGHADFKAYGLDLRGLYTSATVEDVAELNAARKLTGGGSIGERLTGGYAQAGYNLFRTLGTAHQLVPYVRYEVVNTQAEVPEGFSANPVNDRTVTILGAMWKPIPQVSVKADYQLHRNAGRTGIDQFNVNVGYLF